VPNHHPARLVEASGDSVQKNGAAKRLPRLIKEPSKTVKNG
jgi:hypothetical protein